MSMTSSVDDKTPSEITLEVEELEEVIAPKIAINHSETLVSNEAELSVEEVTTAV